MSERRRPRLVVVGSANMDLIASVPRLPGPGETVAGAAFAQAPGGKGANQAVAAARLGAEVRFVGCVGADAFGRELLESLRAAGVDSEGVRVSPTAKTGVALIAVERGGQNQIVVAPGANAEVSEGDVAKAEPAIRGASAVLLQLEIPLAAAVVAARLARRHGVRCVLNPAPAPTAPLPAELARVDAICPNEFEALALTGVEARSLDDAREQVRRLLAAGAALAVVTLGERGAMAGERDGTVWHVPAFPVEAVDATAAGDAFAAALTVALCRGCSAPEAVRFASAAGALAATRPGAQPSLPTLDEVEKLLHSTGGARRPVGEEQR
ncbi:MAG: ribokinase [Kiritimatiellae bacterium]|nr:ribokinase [Kiritimatiellia bacterium]